MVERILSLTSLIITLIVSIISTYLSSIKKIGFETLIWIVIGAIVIVSIMVY